MYDGRNIVYSGTFPSTGTGGGGLVLEKLQSGTRLSRYPGVTGQARGVVRDEIEVTSGPTMRLRGTDRGRSRVSTLTHPSRHPILFEVTPSLRLHPKTSYLSSSCSFFSLSTLTFLVFGDRLTLFLTTH